MVDGGWERLRQLLAVGGEDDGRQIQGAAGLNAGSEECGGVKVAGSGCEDDRPLCLQKMLQLIRYALVADGIGERETGEAHAGRPVGLHRGEPVGEETDGEQRGMEPMREVTALGRQVEVAADRFDHASDDRINQKLVDAPPERSLQPAGQFGYAVVASHDRTIVDAAENGRLQTDADRTQFVGLMQDAGGKRERVGDDHAIAAGEFADRRHEFALMVVETHHGFEAL